MSAKHTQGPWKLQPLETHRNGYDWPTFTVRCPRNHCLAVVGDVDRATAEQNEANARLIAAAPDLLRAAVAALTIVNRENGDGSIAHDLRAAIDRAEGRAE